jgi:hypothetical protein
VHIGYVLAVSEQAGPAGAPELVALVAYTTSQPWAEDAVPPGVFIFDREAAAALGQDRAFVMDLRRLACVVVSAQWFPRLNQSDPAVRQGRMPKRRQDQYVRVVAELMTRYPRNVERLGDRWPGGRR